VPYAVRSLASVSATDTMFCARGGARFSGIGRSYSAPRSLDESQFHRTRRDYGDDVAVVEAVLRSRERERDSHISFCAFTKSR